MLTADNVSFAYDEQPVLRDVTVRVPPGALMGVLGPNGSGKTTLLRLLAGTLRPGAGHVRLDDTDLGSLARVRVARRIAVVPQETNIAFDYTVLEIALMGRYPYLGPFQLEGPDDIAIAREALAATGTVDLQDRLFTSLSGGEKQRVIVAAALAQFGHARDTNDVSGRVLLLDEPTASLDLGYQIEIANLLQRLNSDRRIAVLVSTHDLQFAARLCQELVLLREGRVIAAGSTDEVLTPATIAEAYGVRAEIRREPELGLTTVLPITRIDAGPGRTGRDLDGHGS